MTTSLPGLKWTPGEVALAERLGREGRVHQSSHDLRHLPPCRCGGRADYVALAWAHYADKVQMRAVQIAFAELYRRYPEEAA